MHIRPRDMADNLFPLDLDSSQHHCTMYAPSLARCQCLAQRLPGGIPPQNDDELLIYASSAPCAVASARNAATGWVHLTSVVHSLRMPVTRVRRCGKQITAMADPRGRGNRDVGINMKKDMRCWKVVWASPWDRCAQDKWNHRTLGCGS